MTSFRDVELLSAYLDGQLSPSDSARLESRLSSDADLRAALNDLRSARGLLRKLPQRRAPRNFTLTLKMAGIKPPEPRAYPTLRFATVLATLLFLATFAINGLAPIRATGFASAPAPSSAFGMGGGGCEQGCGGGGPETAPQAAAPATEAPLQTFATNETPTPEITNSMAIRPTQATDNSQSTPEAFTKNSAPSASQLAAPTEVAPNAAPATGNAQPQPAQNEAPIPFVWQIGLAIVAVIFGLAAWLIRKFNESKFRKRWK